MQKILIIGQAPPAVKQKYPYDTTMLYDWLKECNITVDEAQELFEFEAVSNKFPGFGKGGHKLPSQEDMDNHWKETLREKVVNSQKIWILGNVPRDYLLTKSEVLSKVFLVTIHPSKRNSDRFNKQKSSIISQIKKFILL